MLRKLHFWIGVVLGASIFNGLMYFSADWLPIITGINTDLIIAVSNLVIAVIALIGIIFAGELEYFRTKRNFKSRAKSLKRASAGRLKNVIEQHLFKWSSFHSALSSVTDESMDQFWWVEDDLEDFVNYLASKTGEEIGMINLPVDEFKATIESAISYGLYEIESSLQQITDINRAYFERIGLTSVHLLPHLSEIVECNDASNKVKHDSLKALIFKLKTLIDDSHLYLSQLKKL